MYQGDASLEGHQMPIVHGARALLQVAKDHLGRREQQPRKTPDEKAAAVYTRAAFEAKLKAFCTKHSVRVPFDQNVNRVTSESLWQSIKERLKAPGKKDVLPNEAAIREIEMFRKVVLNPLSHSGIAQLTEQEIRSSIRAVDDLKFEDMPYLDRAIKLCADQPNKFSPSACACLLRAAFDESLRTFCVTNGVLIAFRTCPSQVTTSELWTAAKAQVPALSASAALVADIETHRGVLLDELDSDVINVMNPATMKAILSAILAPTPQGPQPTVAAPWQTKLDNL
jgi:hypothetical protein